MAREQRTCRGCGRPRDSKFNYCLDCRRAQSLAVGPVAPRKRAATKKQTMCTRCGDISDSGGKTCRDCRDQAVAWRRDRMPAGFRATRVNDRLGDLPPALVAARVRRVEHLAAFYAPFIGGG